MEANKHPQHATARKLRFVCKVTAMRLLFVYGVIFASLLGNGGDLFECLL